MRPANFPHRQVQRRDEALGRNEAWTSLTPAQQLKELDRRPGRAAKQRAKIQARLQSS